MNLAFDIETNAIDNFRDLEGLREIHCLVLQCLDTGTQWRYSSNAGNIKEGLNRLRNADTIVGHNIISFDIRAIKKLYPRWEYNGCVRDTLVMARCIYANQRELDFGFINKGFPKNLIGSHSLKAWGHRIGALKDDFGETSDWESWSIEMEDYCAQDTAVTAQLYGYLMNIEPSIDMIDLEQDFQKILVEQEEYGFPFDTHRAERLYSELASKRDDLEKSLKSLIPDKVIERVSEKTGRKLKPKVIEFNPASRQMIAEALIERYGWKPVEFTPSGHPKVDESILTQLDFDIVEPVVKYLTIQKRIGQLAEGKEAWLKLVTKQGRIHGRINGCGTVTGRCTHSKPNIAQVPASGSLWGPECRSLFQAPGGWTLVGADASGLELRCLAHYMGRWDEGSYAKEIVQGDIHTANQKAAGLPTRGDAKRFIYAFLYGAGHEKIGSIVGGGVAEGKGLQAKFLKSLPALQSLRKAIENGIKHRGYLVGLDGRRLPIRSKHSALNTLLQSAGAVIMKQATVDLHRKLKARGIEFHQVAHIHDEVQLVVREDDKDVAGTIAVDSIREAGLPYNFKCPLDGEYRTGRSWAETH